MTEPDSFRKSESNRAATSVRPVELPTRPKPNFSGDYRLNLPASTLEGGAASARAAILRIDHHEPMIRIDAKFEFYGKTFAWSLQRATDGREVVDQSDTRAKSSVRWDNDTLVFANRTDAPEVTMTWRYELVDEGRRLRAAERIRGGGRDQDNVWVFDRH